MTSAQATAEIFWIAYKTLSVKERSLIIKKIIEEDEAYEDYVDNKIVEERRGEPSISLEEYITERAKMTEA